MYLTHGEDATQFTLVCYLECSFYYGISWCFFWGDLWSVIQCAVGLNRIRDEISANFGENEEIEKILSQCEIYSKNL